MKYVLDGHKVVREDDVLKWAKWYETADRRVAFDEVGSQKVVTSFLGIDHNFGQGPPLLFETMVFPEFETCFRYATWDEAAAGHAKVLDEVRREVSP